MNKKNQIPVLTRKQVLLRDTGKTLKLKTGLKAGFRIKGDAS